MSDPKRKNTDATEASKRMKTEEPPIAGSAIELKAMKDQVRARLNHIGYVSAKSKNVKPQEDIPKNSCQWDYLLKEMAWMKKDFVTERKWKTNKQKLIVKSAIRAWESMNNREVKDAKMDAIRLKKVGALIGREVKSFWEKIDRVVVYKHRTEFFAKQQSAMDKHLNFLVEQTERYSNALASKLHDKDEPKSDSEDDIFDELKILRADAKLSREEQLLKYANREELETLEITNDALISDNDEDAHGVKRLKSTSLLLDESNDDDYSQDSEIDDENTLNQDDCELSKNQVESELQALKAEAEMSQEELMKLYGYGDNNEKPIIENSDGQYSEDSEIDDEDTMNQEYCEPEENQVESELQALKAEAEMSREELMKLYGYKNEEKLEVESDDEMEWQEEEIGEDVSIDDECEPDQKATENEINALTAEAEMTQEELMKLYGYDQLSESNGDDQISESSDSALGSMSAKQVLKFYGFDNFDIAQEEDEEEFEYSEESDDEGSMDQSCEPHPNSIQEELGDLKREGMMSQEELLELYKKRGGESSSCTEESQSMKVPFLMSKDLRLREYQIAGLHWMASMCDKRLNGILADEMGLGKTVQTISLLAHLACDKGIWGPHLIIVPTSVLLNWEMELKKFCPGFKVLTYYGSTKERKLKRQGWSKPNQFHICITSYQLAVQDAAMFKRRKWYYLILDEAHNIKNFQSQRWQTLISLNTKRRLLLTGTPLQNSLMELWSLMHFLMPHIFRSHSEFKYWFANPLTAVVEGKGSQLAQHQQEKHNALVVKRLHAVIRPFLLRRLKIHVATQLPGKYEHIIKVPLSRRQRYLYEDFISRNSTKTALTGGGCLGMMSILMKLRMVCNHPDIFEPRVIESPLQMEPLQIVTSSNVFRLNRKFKMRLPELEFVQQELSLAGFLKTKFSFQRAQQLAPIKKMLIEELSSVEFEFEFPQGLSESASNLLKSERQQLIDQRLLRNSFVTDLIMNASIGTAPLYGEDLIACVVVGPSAGCSNSATATQWMKQHSCIHPLSSCLADAALTMEERVTDCDEMIRKFAFATPKAVAMTPQMMMTGAFNDNAGYTTEMNACSQVVRIASSPSKETLGSAALFHNVATKLTLAFPDKMLVQYDCGKLQVLASMLRDLKAKGHRVLIFTQMTKMLDILEVFLNIHGHVYFRLDGSTKVESRQRMMERYNRDPRIFAFILSTRSGGLGINLTGADTVIFYDSDWNPSMDAQAQDRAHRIGQTRDVHIYRLISEFTIEENILMKSNQKRHLNKLSVEDGKFTVSSFLSKGGGVSELLGVDVDTGDGNEKDIELAMAQAEDESDKLAACRATKEANEDLEEFNEEQPDDEEAKQQTIPAEEEKDNMNQMQFNELEKHLSPVERYAIEFRTLWFPVVDRSLAQEELAKIEASQSKTWEIDQLEADKIAMEDDMDDELIIAMDGSEFDHSQYIAARTAIATGKKSSFLTGECWDSYPDTNGKVFYLHKETKECTYDKPSILEAAEEIALAISWGGIPINVLFRIFTFLDPTDRMNNALVNKQWACGLNNSSCVLWVENSHLSNSFCEFPREWITVGSSVEALYLDGDVWYPGLVQEVHSNNTYDIVYSDGFLEEGLHITQLRLDKGMRYTFVTPQGEKNPPYGVLSKHHKSRVGCGPLAPPPTRFTSLQSALDVARKGDTIVLQAGTHSTSTNVKIRHNIRILGERLWAIKLNAYEAIAARVKGDYRPYNNNKVLHPPAVEVIGIEAIPTDRLENRKQIKIESFVKTPSAKVASEILFKDSSLLVYSLVHLYGIMIEGATTSPLIVVSKGSLTTLVHCTVHNAMGVGIQVFESVTLLHSRVHDCTTGIESTGCVAMLRSNVASNAVHGVYLDKGLLLARLCEMSGNGKYGVYVNGPPNGSSLLMVGNDLQNNGFGAINFSASASETWISLINIQNNLEDEFDDFKSNPRIDFETEMESSIQIKPKPKNAKAAPSKKKRKRT